MTAVKFITGRAAILARANIDTDQILPPRFLCHPHESGLGRVLFEDLRAADPAFPVRQDGNRPILLAGANFGCGASREAAIQALLHGDVRCIIAVSFGGNFGDLAAQNGLLTIILPPDAFASLLADCRGGAEVTVDLEAERVSCCDLAYRFSTDGFCKRRLLEGWGDIILTFDSRIMDMIDRFEGADARLRAWATPR